MFATEMVYGWPLWLEIAVGAAGGAAFVLLARFASPGRERRIWAAGLVVAALIYVGFARSAGWQALAGELAGVAVFAAVAWLGVRRAPWLLGAGWALHVLWDLALHAVSLPGVPESYPTICAGFDLLVGGYILGAVLGRRT